MGLPLTSAGTLRDSPSRPQPSPSAIASGQRNRDGIVEGAKPEVIVDHPDHAARARKTDYVIVDTAGRLQIDEVLVQLGRMVLRLSSPQVTKRADERRALVKLLERLVGEDEG